MPFDPNGSIYEYKGREYVLYPITRLSKALEQAGYPRSAQSIRLWERNNVTPPSFFKIGGKRLYTQEEIDIFTSVAQECDIRQGVSIEMTGFPERIYEELEALHAKYDTREKDAG